LMPSDRPQRDVVEPSGAALEVFGHRAGSVTLKHWTNRRSILPSPSAVTGRSIAALTWATALAAAEGDPSRT
jgi:hypothetical protein